MRRLAILFGSVLLAGCSLRGLIFDVEGSGGAGGTGASSSSSSASGAMSSSASMCMTASSSSGTGGGGGEVNCTNGIDDDNNGVADCNDPNCTTAGYTCHDVPAGWVGPVALFEGAPPANPCCPSDYPTLGPVGGRTPSMDPFTCTACGCGLATATCTPSPLVIHTTAGCIDPGSSTPQQNGSCKPVSGSLFTAAPPTVTMGTCAVIDSVPLTPPTATWTTVDQLCLGETKGMGCTATQVCARPAAGAFGGALCVYAAGAQMTCPAAFAVKHNFYQGFTDTRGCGPCTCGAPMPPACAATSVFYSTTMCSGGVNKVIGTIPNDGMTCFSLAGAGSFETNVAPPVPTSCAPMGGGTTGTVTEATATELTVCCTQ
jgi:hypothetical protein